MSPSDLKHLYLSLPWTIDVSHDEDDPGRVLRIRELPGFLVVEEADRDLERDFWDALEGYIDSHLEFGDPLPLPAGVNMDREIARRRPVSTSPMEPAQTLIGTLGLPSAPDAEPVAA